MRWFLFRLVWFLALPIRAYVRWFPYDLAKDSAAAWFLFPLLGLPDESKTFTAEVAEGARVVFRYREDLGKFTAAFGHFEREELAALLDKVPVGAIAIDVGANLGIYTVALAVRVGASGHVYSLEPFTESAQRLLENVRLNALQNVTVFEVAAGRSDGSTLLRLGDDSAYHSTDHVLLPHRATGRVLAVTCRRLDSIWLELDRPNVAAIKIDVEGAELSVLEGAMQLLAEVRPVLLVEASAGTERIREALRDLRYSYRQPRGFGLGNHLLIPE